MSASEAKDWVMSHPSGYVIVRGGQWLGHWIDIWVPFPYLARVFRTRQEAECVLNVFYHRYSDAVVALYYGLTS